jgi:hypothetical protein
VGFHISWHRLDAIFQTSKDWSMIGAEGQRSRSSVWIEQWFPNPKIRIGWLPVAISSLCRPALDLPSRPNRPRRQQPRRLRRLRRRLRLRSMTIRPALSRIQSSAHLPPRIQVLSLGILVRVTRLEQAPPRQLQPQSHRSSILHRVVVLLG